MALRPDSEKPDLSVPDDYQHDHPEEHPKMWGWHGEWGRSSRAGGFIVMAILLLMITATQYNFAGAIWLVGFAIAIVILMIWDHHRRKRIYR